MHFIWDPGRARGCFLSVWPRLMCFSPSVEGVLRCGSKWHLGEIKCAFADLQSRRNWLGPTHSSATKMCGVCCIAGRRGSIHVVFLNKKMSVAPAPPHTETGRGGEWVCHSSAPREGVTHGTSRGVALGNALFFFSLPFEGIALRVHHKGSAQNF